VKWKAPEMGELITCRRTCKVSEKSPPRYRTAEMDPAKRQKEMKGNKTEKDMRIEAKEKG
jgi:hypothetical protein